MTRRGFTLTELGVAVAVGMVVILVVFQAAMVLLNAERTTDRAARRALVEAALLETLLQDIRSARNVSEQAPGRYLISRNVRGPSGRLVPIDVTWAVVEHRVIRQAPGEAAQEFELEGLRDPRTLAVKLKLTKEADAGFRR